MSLSANEIDAYVGQRLRERREALGLSQGRLGRHLGLTFSQIQKYEKGSNRIGAGRLFQIAEFLGVPTDYFFNGLEQPAAPAPARAGVDAPFGATVEEMRILTTAFAAISEKGTRGSVLALVKSLASEDESRLPRGAG